MTMAKTKETTEDRKIPMPNHFEIPCSYIEALPTLRADEMKVFAAICHKDSAFFLPRAVMSTSSLIKVTGLRACDVATAVWSLKQRGWIKEAKSPKGKLLGYEMDYEE